jgi:hypothetical protein
VSLPPLAEIAKTVALIAGPEVVALVAGQVSIPRVSMHRQLAQGSEGRVCRLSSCAPPCPRLIDAERPPAELETVEQQDGVQDRAGIAVFSKGKAAVAGARCILGQAHVALQRTSLV